MRTFDRQPLSAGLLALSLSLFAAAPQAEDAAASTEAPVDGNAAVISVNGTPITRNMFTIFYQRTVPQQSRQEPLTDQMRTALLDQLVNYLLLAQEADKQGLDQQPEVKAGLELVRAEYLANLVLSGQALKEPVLEEDLKKLYEEETAGPAQKEYKARHILLKEESEARDMIAQLDKGADFQELAKAHSTGPSGPNGGDLGWFGAGRMVPAFEQAVLGMEPGKWSSEPVKTQFGWHVILLEETRDKPKPEYEKIKSRLAQAEQQRRLREYLSQIRSQADVKVLGGE